MRNKLINRILFVGDTTWPMYVRAFFDAALRIGNIVPFVYDYGIMNSSETNESVLRRIQYKYSIGPNVWFVNRGLLSEIEKKNIDCVFLYSARIISWKTVKKIKKKGCTVCIYCNDNPFSKYYSNRFWKNIRRSVKYSDITYSYRSSDIYEYKAIGAKNVKLLRSYYIEDRNYKIPENIIEKNNINSIPRVIFLGHWENDDRGEYIEALIENNVEIGLQNSDRWRAFSEGKDNIILIDEYIDKYNEIINIADIAIVFLSKINRDTYTRRCFEIPAAGTLMIAEYTSDLASMFIENEEAVFFRNKDDFVYKIKYYLEHNIEREQIAERGMKRVVEDGHDSVGRVCQILTDLENL